MSKGQNQGIVESIKNIYRQWPQILLKDRSKERTPFQDYILGIMRLVYALARDLMSGELSLRAMSLVYTTLISIVPLLALSFSVLKGFGVHNQLEPFLLNLLDPLGPQADVITNRILDFVDNIEVGVLGAFGLGFLTYVVISLMQKIEKSFNYIWHVERPRSLAQRFSDYLSVLLVGPLFLFVSAGLTTGMRSMEWERAFVFGSNIEQILDVAGFFLPYLIMAIAFTCIYLFMPNTRVRFKSAFIGGLFAALLWKTMGFLFTELIASSGRYVAIYAAFAALIIFMIWLYLAWFVVLLGASLAFYVQNPRYTVIGLGSSSLSWALREKLCLEILCLIGSDFEAKKENWDLVKLSQHLNCPIHILSSLMDHLEKSKLICKTSEFEQTYVPGKPFDQLTIGQAMNAIRDGGDERKTAWGKLDLSKPVLAIYDAFQKEPKDKLSKPLSSLWHDQACVKATSKKKESKKSLIKKKPADKKLPKA